MHTPALELAALDRLIAYQRCVIWDALESARDSGRATMNALEADAVDELRHLIARADELRAEVDNTFGQLTAELAVAE